MMFSSPRLRRFTFQHGFFLTQIVRRFLSVTNSTSSVESIDSFRLCTWNQTTQVCVADAMRIWSSFNLTTLDAPKLRDLAFMLECASYAQNSTDCSANPFCQKSADGTCRTSSGPTTLRSIYSVAQSTVDSCGWIGATIGGYQCQLHSLSECRNAGCSIKADGFILNGSQCAMGPTCIDDTMSYMLRLCSTDPNWDLAKMAGCFSLGDDTKLLIECTQAVCPQFAAMLEHTLFDPCASLKTRNACMSNSACWMNVQGVCEKDKFNSWLAMAPPDCPLARASAWAERCSEARTAEFCAQLGHECVWEKLEVCAAEGPAAPLEQCRGAPEMLGLYLRPSTNVSPTIDLLSKIIVSAHTCPYVEFQECVPPDRSNGGVDSDAAATPASIMVLVVVGGIVLAFIGACVASCLLWHRHCIVATTQKEGVVNAMPAQAVPEQVQAVAQGNALTEIVSDSQGSPRNAYAENTITEEITASSLDFMHGDPVSTLARGATEHWLIHPDALNLNSEIIGKGGFGEVIRGLLHGNTQIVAKRQLVSPSGMAKSSSTLANEIRLLRRIRHPNIVLFHGVSFFKLSDEQASLCIILEWVSGGDLSKFVVERHQSGSFKRDSETNTLQFKEVKLMQDVARGLGYLHAQTPPILHRDVKPANILIENHEPPLAKLADFGLSLLEDGRNKNKAGTRSYMAPEVRDKKEYGLPSDIYSFGCVLFFVNSATSDLSRAVEMAWALPPSLLKLAELCIVEDPALRPNGRTLYSTLHESCDSCAATGSTSAESGSSSKKQSL